MIIVIIFWLGLGILGMWWLEDQLPKNINPLWKTLAVLSGPISIVVAVLIDSIKPFKKYIYEVIDYYKCKRKDRRFRMKTMHIFRTELTEREIKSIIAKYISNKTSIPVLPEHIELVSKPILVNDMGDTKLMYGAIVDCIAKGELK